jgi:hypothetical protein
MDIEAASPLFVDEGVFGVSSLSGTVRLNYIRISASRKRGESREECSYPLGASFVVRAV